MSPTIEPVDILEELRLRRWARENYCFAEARQASWHPIVHDEMRRRDNEGLSADDISVLAEYDKPPKPTDSTVLADIPKAAGRTDVAAVAAIPLGRIVPLAPNLPELHGPHEITPPHTRIGAPSETSELHFG